MRMKTIILLTVVLIFSLMPGMTLSANSGRTTYLGYTFDHWGYEVPSPAAYMPVRSIGGRDIDSDIGSFRAPEDLATDIDGNIYVADTGNNRVVVFNTNLDLINIFDGFYQDGIHHRFDGPRGVFVTENLDIYIADTGNHRVVSLNQNGEWRNTIENPESDILAEGFVFHPLKVTVDRAGRVYVIARNVYEGIMFFSPEGEFFGYFGTVQVQYTFTDWIWRQLSTQAQRAQQRLFIPMELSGMDVDNAGFIFATVADSGFDDGVMRINPSGNDVLRNFTPHVIAGDINRLPTALSPTVFVDIVVRDNGKFSVLDSTRRRLFTYDSEGNLLYVIGGMGNTMGMGRQPSAVGVIGNDIFILDRLRGEIVHFEETLYGQLINGAVSARYNDDEAGAVEKWRQVLMLNENFALANRGIGRALLAAGENQLAMAYLRRGMDVDHYAIALRRHRSELLEENIGYALTVAAILGAAVLGYHVYKKRKQRDMAWRT